MVKSPFACPTPSIVLAICNIELIFGWSAGSPINRPLVSRVSRRSQHNSYKNRSNAIKHGHFKCYGKISACKKQWSDQSELPYHQTQPLIGLGLCFSQTCANSTVKCPGRWGGEHFLRGFVSEDFSGPRIEQICGPVNVSPGDAIEALVFWEVLADQSFGVFVEAALP